MAGDARRDETSEKKAQEQPGQTLQATALVHEAYIRLVDVEKAQHWNSRGHFFAAAAEAMRRILVGNARRKKNCRQGGGFCRIELEAEELATGDRCGKLLALDEALAKLAQREPLKAELVELRFFAGLTTRQAAQMIGVPTATADRYWTYARAWLQREMSPDEDAFS